jgi:L-histidine Nalpha-methyltransferase
MASATWTPNSEATRPAPGRGDVSAGETQRAFLLDVLAGLAQRPRSLPSRYFYDGRGSRLFEWITQLPDYYLTRTEREILEGNGDALAACFAGASCTLVDLGAGDGHNSRLVLERLRARCRSLAYAPIDVSGEALDEASARVRERWPDVRVRPIHAEYRDGLRQLAARGGRGPRLVLFVGSSIGNLEWHAAVAFLKELRGALRRGDHALVGFDLVKPLDVLRRAYDDPQGVTRAFNLNLLARMNRELGADFDLGGFRHRATWDPRRPAMESWLESRRRQTVHLAGRAIELAPRERIHTEISWKYTPAQVGDLAREAGFLEVARFTDARQWFVDALWRVG